MYAPQRKSSWFQNDKQLFVHSSVKNKMIIVLGLRIKLRKGKGHHDKADITELLSLGAQLLLCPPDSILGKYLLWPVFSRKSSTLGSPRKRKPLRVGLQREHIQTRPGEWLQEISAVCYVMTSPVEASQMPTWVCKIETPQQYFIISNC